MSCIVEGESGAISRELLMVVVREAVYNSVLHANAEQVDIQIRYDLEAKALP